MSQISFRFHNSTTDTLYIGWNDSPSIVTVNPNSDSPLQSAELASNRLFPLIISSDQQISMPILLMADELPQALPRVMQQVGRNENWEFVQVFSNGKNVWTFNVEHNPDGILIVGTVEVVSVEDLVASPSSSMRNM